MTTADLYGPPVRDMNEMSVKKSTVSSVSDFRLSSVEASGNENNQNLKSMSSKILQRQDSSSSNNSNNGESVIIEEKRKRAHGEGYTSHRYLRGRLLGKGGFAKVYLCTALDTNKQYAVKIVPKANLVKSRARQKVRD